MANPTDYVGPSAFTAGNLAFSVPSKQATSDVSFRLQIKNHPIWKSEKLSLNLGELATDNANRGAYYRCELNQDGATPWWVKRF